MYFCSLMKLDAQIRRGFNLGRFQASPSDRGNSAFKFSSHNTLLSLSMRMPATRKLGSGLYIDNIDQARPSSMSAGVSRQGPKSNEVPMGIPVASQPRSR
jgi:hypothetical protein